MSIFGKHVLRSIRRSPFQSFLVVLTLVISTAAFLVSSKTFFKIKERLNEYEGVDNYVSDITVELSSKSDLRILFEDDLKSLVGERAEILGEFRLDGLCYKEGKREFIKLCALDFERADEFYGFKFTDYGEFTSKKYKESIIISTDLAKEYGLSVGDEISFLLLNQTFDFTVEAIALSEGPLFEYGGVLSIDAVRDELARSNPAIQSFAESFVPYSAIRIRVKDKDKIEEVYEELSADGRFSDKRVFKNADEVGNYNYYTTLSLVITGICAVFVVGLAGIVISTSLDIIRKKRKNDTALFALCGAERGHLNKIVYIESAIYSVFGFVGGVVFASYFYGYVNKCLQWNENGLESRPVDWLIAMVAAPLIMLMSTLIHLGKERRKTSYEIINADESNKSERSGRGAVAVLTLFAVSFAITILLPITERLVPAIVTMLAAILLIFCFIEVAFRLIAKLFIALAKGRLNLPSVRFMAYKNIHASYALGRIARLLTVLFVIIYVVLFSAFSVSDQMEMFENVVLCDYVAVGADSGSDAILEKEESVTDTFRFAIVDNVKTKRGSGVICISAEDDAYAYIHGRAKPRELPHNDEAVISVGLAKLYGAGVGDRISLFIEGEEEFFTVLEIIDVQSTFAFIDVTHVGAENDKLAIVTDGALEDEEQLSVISSILSPRGAGVVNLAQANKEFTEFPRTMINCVYVITRIAAVTAFIGVLNLILSGHNSRKQEFEVLYLSGFTRKKILALEICEIVTVTLLSAIFAVPLGFSLSWIFDNALNSFGCDFVHFFVMR